jgi:hypothetical protein
MNLLLELIGIKNGHIDDTFPNFILELAKKHGIEIKEGLQAHVLLIPGKNYVYRIWVHDSGYEDWLRYCETHQSKYLPKVLSKVRTLNVTFKRLPKDLKLKVVKLERLDPIDNVNFENALAVFNQLIFRMRLSKIKTLSIDELIEEMKNVPDDTYEEPGPHIESVVRHYEGFFEYIQGLVETLNDIAGDNNVMMRGDTPVLSDPLS